MRWISLKVSKQHPENSLCALQELVNQGQAVVCFCHVSQLQQPCSPQKSMAKRQLPPEGIKRSVCTDFS